MAPWPKELSALEAFLAGVGMERRGYVEGPWRGDRALEYEGERAAVRLVGDRGRYFVDVADMREPQTWYDVALLRDLLVGPGPDVLSIGAQAMFVEAHWQAILDAFNSSRAPLTHRTLAEMRKKRAARRFPRWPGIGQQMTDPLLRQRVLLIAIAAVLAIVLVLILLSPSGLR